MKTTIYSFRVSNPTLSANYVTASRISIEFLALLSLHVPANVPANVPAKTRIEFHLFNQSLKANSSRIVHAEATDLFAGGGEALVKAVQRNLHYPLQFDAFPQQSG